MDPVDPVDPVAPVAPVAPVVARTREGLTNAAVEAATAVRGRRDRLVDRLAAAYSSDRDDDNAATAATADGRDG